MAIVIIDSFEINHSGPIDARIIATSSTERNEITWLYDGLKVFQLSDRTYWTWNASELVWDEDPVGNVGTPNGISPYVPYWLSSRSLGNSPMLVTQSGTYSNSGIQIQKYLYLGDSANLHNYGLQIGDSSDGFLTLAATSDFNGIKFVLNSSSSDAINGGPVTHKFTTDTNGTYITLLNQAGYVGGAIQVDNSENLSLVTAGNFTAYSYFGSVNLACDGFFGSASSISLYSGSAYISTNLLSFSASTTYVLHQFSTIESVYQNIGIFSLNGPYTVAPQDHNLILTNTGSSVAVNLPDASAQNGRLLTIQAATISTSNLVVTPFGAQKIYSNGSFVSSFTLYQGDLLDLKAFNGIWYSTTQLTNEPWKNISVAGSMRNGQSIPVFSSPSFSNDPISFPAFNSLQRLSIRKTKDNYVEIRGMFHSTVSGFSTVLTLPVGYRPALDRRGVTVYVNAETTTECFILANGIVSMNVISSDYHSIEFRFEAGV